MNYRSSSYSSLLPYNSISLTSKSSTLGTSSLKNGWASFIYLSLWASNVRQQSKKCIVDSALAPHMQILLSVSVNLCLNLFAMRVLNPIVSWYGNLRSSMCVFKTPFSGHTVIHIKIALEADSFSVWRSSCLKSFQLVMTASGWNDFFEPQIFRTRMWCSALLIELPKLRLLRGGSVMWVYALSSKTLLNDKTSVSNLGAPILPPRKFWLA